MAREMKDSGIPWIGEIPVDWSIIKLFHLRDQKHHYPIGDGDHGSIKPEHYIDTGIPYIRVQNLSWGSGLKLDDVVFISPEVNNANEKSILYPGDILIAKTGATIGKTGIIPDSIPLANTTSSVGKVTIDKKYSNKYYFYVLGSDVCIRQMWEKALQKSAQPGFNIEDLVAFKVPFPSEKEQFCIADFLDKECARIDSVIEQTRASIEEYRKLKQSVITEAVTKGICPNHPMKDSGIEWIGEIASDFDLQKLKYVSKILDQFRSPITADQRNQDAEVLYDYYGASGAIDKINGYTIDDHVMLIGEDGANLRMRNLPLMYEVNGKAWINNHAHILKPKENTHFNYLFYVLEAIDINPYITGSAQPKLSQENLKNIWLPVPSFEEQAEIAEYLQIKIPKIDELIDQKHQFLSELESYKKSLIYEYVTGKKEVSV